MTERFHQLHKACLDTSCWALKDRLQALCAFFLGVKYGAWQNGSDIESLDDFNYDLTKLDCVTYVEVVLALIKTIPDVNFECFWQDFLYHLRNIHYAGGVPNFLHSNHITCVDWIPNNSDILRDMTEHLQSPTQMAITQIDRLGYFKHHKINAQNCAEFAPHIRKKLTAQESRIPYIATCELLDNYAQMLQTFPEYCVINLVRPNWNLVEKIGTHLNISHMGFAIKNSDASQISFYHATIEKMQVVVENLDTYMQRHIESPTIRGINVLAICSELDTENPQTLQS